MGSALAEAASLINGLIIGLSIVFSIYFERKKNEATINKIFEFEQINSNLLEKKIIEVQSITNAKNFKKVRSVVLIDIRC